MYRHENRADMYVVLLATFFGLFTFAQTARPLESIALFSHHGVTAKYYELTRHTLKEVGSSVADLSTAATTESGNLALEGPPRVSRANLADVAVWPVQITVHRRISPPPPDDTH
jgi:hypothetical protein